MEKSELLEFGSVKECTKCGFRPIERAMIYETTEGGEIKIIPGKSFKRSHETLNRLLDQVLDCLYVECPLCGWEWMEKCKDATENKDDSSKYSPYRSITLPEQDK